MTLNPRDTFASIATLYGYTPSDVINVDVGQEETIITFRLANAAGGYTVTGHGFLMTPGVKAQLDAMATAYGYDPTQVARVMIGRYESLVLYRTLQNDGVTVTMQGDSFTIPAPAPSPTIAATDTGAAPA